MSQSIPLTFRAAPFPEGYQADPEQLKNDIVARLYAESTEAISFFASGSIAPSSNVGPWLKDGKSWYVWSDGLAMYIPQVLQPQSLGYIAQLAAPDHTIYTFWIQLDGAGKATAINYYSGGAWKDVYEDKFATINAAWAAGDSSTLASANAYTNGAVASSSFPSYPAQGIVAAPQTVAVDGNDYKVALTVASINPAPAPFDTTNRRYIAPAAGVYATSATCQIDNGTGAAATMETGLSLFKNGVYAGNALADLDGTPNPNGGRWSPGFAGLISLAQNDYLELFVRGEDTVDTGNIIVSTAQMSVNRISA